MPRYSPEAQELAKARGILEPLKKLRMDKGDVAEWNSMSDEERWLLPPSKPKPSSAGLTLTAQPKPSNDLISKQLRDLQLKLEDKKISIDEFVGLHNALMLKL
jgi:hypothetical protein